ALIFDFVTACAKGVEIKRPVATLPAPRLSNSRRFNGMTASHQGCKERLCPLWPQTATLLRELCAERWLDLRAAVPIFVNQRGQPLSRFGVCYILAKYLKRAQATVPSLKGKHLHLHS